MTSDRVTMVRAGARAAARGTVSTLRSRAGHRPHATLGRQEVTPDGRTVELRAAPRRRGVPYDVEVTVVSCAGARLGELWTRADAGTATYEIVPRLDLGREADAEAGADDAALTTALRLVIDEVQVASPELRMVVRRSLDPLVPGPGPALLEQLGLTHVATFPGDVASPQAWAGEERWDLVDRSG